MSDKFMWAPELAETLGVPQAALHAIAHDHRLNFRFSHNVSRWFISRDQLDLWKEAAGVKPDQFV